MSIDLGHVSTLPSPPQTQPSPSPSIAVAIAHCCPCHRFQAPLIGSAQVRDWQPCKPIAAHDSYPLWMMLDDSNLIGG